MESTLGALAALGMASAPGVNLPTSDISGAHTQAITLAVGQAFVTLAFVGVTVYLLALGKTVDGQLWTLDVALASFYMGQRVNLVKPG